MNPAKQFWTLVKFQFLLNPVMWFLPLIMGMTTLIPFLSKGDATYHSSLSFYFYTNQNFFFVGIFGSMILAPDRFQMNRMRSMLAYSGTEFLLTRAIDRPILYRSKAFLLYALILVLPVCAMIYFLGKPALMVQEMSKNETKQVLEHVPDSIAAAAPSSPGLQPTITIPYGNVLLAEWQVWNFLLAILVLQLLLSILAPFKFGRMLFWAICYLGLLGPAFLPLFQIERVAHNLPSTPETIFFFFADHQLIIWACTLLGLLACHLFCERKFARQEQ